MGTRNHRGIALGLKKKARYDAYRKGILNALEKGPLFQRELAKTLGMTTFNYFPQNKKYSQFAQCVKDLLDAGIVQKEKGKRFVRWSLVSPITPTIVSTGQTDDVQELFLRFMAAMKKEAQKEAKKEVQHEINSMQAAIDGYVKIIKAQEGKPKDEGILQKLFNFKTV